MKTRYLMLLAVAMIAAPVCFAGTIASVLPATIEYQRGFVAPGVGVYSFGWSQTGSYNNVAIRMAFLETFSPGIGGVVEAYLTDQVGAGTTSAANELIPAVTVPFAAGHSGLLTLFTGLSLGPGNYFVTVTPAATHGTAASIGEVSLPSLTLDTGVAILGYGIDIGAPSSYIPDMPDPWIFSAWAFEVSGDPVVDGVPEPSSVVLLCSGLSALAYRLRRG